MTTHITQEIINMDKKESIFKKLQLWFNNKSIKFKFELIFLIITISISVVCGLFVFYSTSNAFFQRYQSEAMIRCNIAAENLKNDLDENIYSIFKIIDASNDENLKQTANKSGDSVQNARYNLLSSILMSLPSSMSKNLYFYDMDGELIYTYGDRAKAGDLFATRELFDGFASSAEYYTIDMLRSKNSGCVRFIMKTSYTGILSDINYIAYDYPTSNISVSYAELDDKLNSLSFVVDAYGIVLSSGEEKYIGNRFQDIYDGNFADDVTRISIKNEKYLCYAHEANKSHWKLIVCIPEATIYGNMKAIIITLLAEPIIFCAFSFLLLIVMRKMLTIPIMKLTEDIENSSLPYHITKFEPKYKDEIGILARAFYDKNEQIATYIENISKTEGKYRRAQFSAYTAQLNPHMLHNTLSTITWLIEDKRNNEAVTAIKNLSDILRSTMGKNTDIIIIREEVELLKKYLEIQKLRYSDRFKYIYLVDEDIMTYLIPHIILQPIVENAIYHGIKLLLSGGLIIIKGYKQDQDIVFQVMDNGPADENDMKNINDRINNEEEDCSGLGIKNVHLRLKHNYGDGYGLIYKKVNGYTVAEIRIPAIRPKEK